MLRYPDPASLNAALRDRYHQELYSTEEKRWWQEKRLGYSGPLLLDATEEYCAADFRVAFVGQQTNGWTSHHVGRGAIQRQIDQYRSFLRDEVFTKDFRSPFWDAALGLVEELGQPPESLIWTNLYRWDQRKGTPELPRAWRTSRQLLGQELRLLAPDFLVFAVGTTLAWELQDFLDLETSYRYEPLRGGGRGWVLGQIFEGDRVRGLHMVHPGARRIGKRADFVKQAWNRIPD